VDPGTNDLFVAVSANHGVRGDGEDGGDGAVYKLHNAQYLRASGFAKHQRWLERHSAGFKSAERLLARTGSQHTCCIDSFLEYVVCAVQLMANGKAVYGCVAARRWDLRVHRLHQKEMHRISQCLAFCGTGVKGRWSVYDRTWRPAAAGGVASKDAIPQVAIVGLGDASAGWGSIISRKISAPVAALTSFFRREYSSSGGVERGMHGAFKGGRCSMHILRVSEHRSSQTCSRCFHEKPMVKHGVFKLKRCDQTALQGGHTRQQQQQHAAGLVLNRDVNAARCLTARTVYDLFPGWMIDRQQRVQLEKCLVRQSPAAAAAAAGGGGAAAAAVHSDDVDSTGITNSDTDSMDVDSE
jgi:hypothetical protein